MNKSCPPDLNTTFQAAVISIIGESETEPMGLQNQSVTVIRFKCQLLQKKKYNFSNLLELSLYSEDRLE